MPILSGTFTAAGNSTFDEGCHRLGNFFGFAEALALWVRFLDASDLTAAGDSSATFVGSAGRTLIAVGAFTYDPVAVVGFSGTIRREPAISIRHALNVPSILTCGVVNVVPLVGNDVQVDFGEGLLFGGTIQRVDQLIEDSRFNKSWKVTAVDHSSLLTDRYPFGCFTKVSATTVVVALMTEFAPDFDTSNVELGLPLITVTFAGAKTLLACLTEICELISATMRVDTGYKLFLYLTDPDPAPDQLNNTTNTTLLLGIESSEDFSQVKNRVIAYGRTATIVEDVAPGSSTITVDDRTIFTEPGRATADCQRFSFGGAAITVTAVRRPDSPNPFTAKLLREPSGAVVNGVVRIPCAYAAAFIDENGVESALSAPVIAQNDGYFYSSQDGATIVATTGGAMAAGTYHYHVTQFTTAGTETFNGGFTGDGVTLNPGQNAAQLSNISSVGDTRVSGRHIWRDKAIPTEFGPGGVPLFYLVGTINDLTTTTFLDTAHDTSLNQKAPVDQFGLQFNGLYTEGGNTLLENIPRGPVGTQSVKIYRALRNYFTGIIGEEFIQLTTLPRGVTTYLDTKSTPDLNGNLAGAEGGSAPPGDLPPIVRAVITGVSGITQTILKGTRVTLFVQRDNLPAQLALALRRGGDGVREYPIMSPESTTTTQLNAVADAVLALYANPIITVTYPTLDPKTHVGAIIDINLTEPPLVTSQKIQTVDVDLVHEANGVAARYRVSASSVKFTLNDLLRRVVLR